MMKHWLLSVLFLVFASLASLHASSSSPDTLDTGRTSGKFSFEGYSGGMLLHTGYVGSREFSISSSDGYAVTNMRLRGAPIGIGGALRVRFGKHLRIGTEGYVSTLYGRHGSYQKLGWGGLLADCAWDIDKWIVFVGGTVGGGGVTNLVSTGTEHDDYIMEGDDVLYRKYPVVLLAPFFGAEYAVTQKMHLMIKADYICNLSNWQDDYVSGVRIYFGFMFCH